METKEFHKYVLPNGIRCILKQVKSPVAWCALTVNAGSRDEHSREQGIAHFTEHLLFKGTSRRRSYHINNRLEKLGGELNAFTTKEETVVHSTALRADIPKAAELISDIIFHSTFPAREIETEREVILDEINSYKDSPPDRIYDEFEDLLFARSPLGHNILGTPALVSGFTAGDVRRFTGRTYNTDQMVFSVGGNLSQKRFTALAERFFADAPVSSRDFQRTTPPVVAPFNKSVCCGTHQAHCILGGRAYGMNDPRRIALSLMINILGGPAANSRLSTILREKNGLTYTADASFTPYFDTGVAAVYFGTDKEKTDRCLEIIDSILHDFKTRELSARQLSAAKKQLSGQLAISMEAREAYMLGAAKSYLTYNDVDSPKVLYDKINGVKSAEIMEVARDVFGRPSMLLYR